MVAVILTSVDSKARDTLYDVVNSTTEKYFSVALIQMYG